MKRKFVGICKDFIDCVKIVGFFNSTRETLIVKGEKKGENHQNFHQEKDILVIEKGI